MTEKQILLLLNVRSFVTDLFLTKVNKSISFHTLDHTQDVVEACEKMSEYYQLEENDKLALSLAAWFHDTGYSGGSAAGHEAESVNIATRFLNEQHVESNITEKVIACINATRMPQQPAGELEKIMCDADLFHLGTDAFREKSRLLREELNTFGGLDISKKDWRKSNISFLEQHHYFTTYAQQHLQPIKEQHLHELKAKENGEVKGEKEDKSEKVKGKSKKEEPDKQAAEAKKRKEKDNQTERGISTVFRIMANNHASLSQMADSKANILISVNSIILTIVISTLFSKLETYSNLQIPVIVLVAVCVSAIVFSILATRPNVSTGTFTREDIEHKKTNLLFFGNFHQMSLPDYDWAMQEMLNDRDYLYGSMVKDLYFLGVVLARKYRYLRIAYNIFMFGLIIAMIAFALAFILPQPVVVYTPG